MTNETKGKAAHTPGPWHLDPEPHDDAGFYIQAGFNPKDEDDPNCFSITEVNQPEHGRIDWATHVANACLIAAAPELLEALEDMRRLAASLEDMLKEGQPMDPDTQRLADDQHEQARAALAKATLSPSEAGK